MYLYDGQKFASKEFSIMQLTDSELVGTIGGEQFVAGKHRTKLDVKAVTYHQITIRQLSEGWSIRYFLDI